MAIRSRHPLTKGGASNTMNIIIKDEKTGKAVKIAGSKMDFELFINSDKSKFDWVTCRRYYGTLPAAVYGALDILLKQPGDDVDTVYVEAEKARVALGKILHDRLGEIVAEVEKQQ